MKELIAGLAQKRGLDYRNHYLYPDKILVETKSKGKIMKYDISLELLGFNKHFEAESPQRRTTLTATAFVVPAVVGITLFLSNVIGFAAFGLFYLLSGGLAALVYSYNAPQDDLFLIGGQKNLVFYRNIPDEEKVSEFIGLVISTTREHFKSKFTQFDNTMPYEVFNWRLMWLRENNLIDETEFKDLMEDYKISRLLL